MCIYIRIHTRATTQMDEDLEHDTLSWLELFEHGGDGCLVRHARLRRGEREGEGERERGREGEIVRTGGRGRERGRERGRGREEKEAFGEEKKSERESARARASERARESTLAWGAEEKGSMYLADGTDVALLQGERHRLTQILKVQSYRIFTI